MFGSREATRDEQLAVIDLKHAASSILPQAKQLAATAPVRPAAYDRTALIKDMNADVFYNLRAEVVNTYYTRSGTVELKLTDYTPNNGLYLYVDPEDDLYDYQKGQAWQGPYGKLTITVVLYDNNAEYARESVAAGDLVYLTNLRIKWSPDGFLEGALYADRQRPNKVDIRKLHRAEDIRELKERKAEYEREYTKKSAKKSALEKLQNEPKKPSAKASAKKKAEKRARQRAQKEQELKEIEEQAEEWDAARHGVNLNSRYHLCRSSHMLI